MNVKGIPVSELLRPVTARLRNIGKPRIPLNEELPLRSELFGADQMELYGGILAASHELSSARGTDQLLARLDENEATLFNICRVLTEAVMADKLLTPAGEWLYDNFYLVEEQIRIAKRHLPKSYSRELPLLAKGASANLPRVYDIALQAISHGDGRVDTESLRRFVTAYQSVVNLQLGELWAIPIMLRLSLIENLRRVGVHVAAGRADRNLADTWADEIIRVAAKDPKSLVLVIADMARSNPPMTTPFISELVRRLQGQGPTLVLPLTWIEQRLAESNQTIDQLVQLGNQQQAADQVSISNSINSLRSLGAIDWREFVETTSVVEQTLREDPSGIYADMDFASRDHYRHVVERLAKVSPLSEVDVARTALRLAHNPATSTAGENVKEHVGFYLTGDGLADLEEAIKVRWSLHEQFWRTARKYPLFWYLSSIAFVTLGLTSALLVEALEDGANGWLLGLVGILALLAMSQLAVALVNWASPFLVKPHLLPRLDFSSGIPSSFQTLVVVPTMLSRESEVAALVEALEVRFLANQDENVYFGLLTDFMDANQETLPEDDSLLRIARTGIEDLNRKYANHSAGNMIGGMNGAPEASAQKQETRFFLFHRPRRWNPQEGVWMGHERKRGKLADLNALLRGEGREAFSVVVGNTDLLVNIKYVITLDTDTQLPREIVHQFVGAMAHPLNRPRLKRTSGNAVVTEGYGILQPRVAVTLSSTNRSRYAWLFGGEAGIDPYTRVVSDVYQDLFYEGSFIGKGIYDVDAFEQSVCRRFPENRILSHDLLEGCYARAGLLSDVQLYEQFPSRYSADVSRRHRWIRGDWQLASWLLARVPGPGGSNQPNPLSILSRWKLMDNLRRSLVPVALLLLLLVGWLALDNAWFWTLVVIGTVIIPSAITMASDLLKRQGDAPLRAHVITTLRTGGRHFAQNLFGLVCLPYEAYFSLDAILRTHVRLLLTHRRLLEWTPSHLAEREYDSTNRWGGVGASFRSMWIAPATAVAAGAGMMVVAPVALISALPILLLWGAAPFIAWWISQPLPLRSTELNKGQIHFLRQTSRRTWYFFENFVNSENNWLPPDNFQEHPVPTVAHRTSPTNMGLALLANVTAYDFGYIGPLQLIERTRNTLESMETLERHAGHFYNWYDTQTKTPLTRYVSSVDSGNLAGHLLTLRVALMAIADRPIVHEELFQALADTLQILESTPGSEAASTPLSQFGKALRLARENSPHAPFSLHAELDRLTAFSREIMHEIEKARRASTGQEPLEWARALNRQCELALTELAHFMPSAALEDRNTPAEIPSLRQLAHQGGEAAREHLAALERLVFQAGEMAKMEYGFLFNPAQRQLAIGYNVGEQRRDASYYDLLASEARFTNFVAIAQGQLPQESWFALGRMLTAHDGETALLSWSGSMFEYLMPLLVMPTFENTLLDQTCKAAVNRQIAYGRERGVPWGISESGYNAVDVQFNYQYRAFGVPGLGIKRGLGEDLVIAPYASALALMIAPEAACRNLEELTALGMMGKFGFYEALDYTPSRLRRGETYAIVRSFMAHHQGMSFLSLAYLLLDRPMQRRFDSEPIFQATMLLLQERIPKATVIRSPIAELPDVRVIKELPEMPIRLLSTANTPIPEVQLLSNGRYHVMVTNSGAGSSRWKDLAITRWREDGTCDYWGNFCYLRDIASGEFWSNTYQPVLKEPKRYGVVFSEGRVEFRRRDLDFDTHTEITVSPEDDIELRRVRITNRAWTRREIEITSYAEVVLAPAIADAQAPAFGNLFVQTEILADRHAILCSRRPRSQSDLVPWMFHLMTVDGVTPDAASYETSRMAFIGRGNDVSAPAAMMEAEPLSGSSGSVLDPVVAIRKRMMLEPGESAIVDIVTGAGDSRHAVMHLVEKYQDQHLKNRVFDLAWTHSLVVLRQLNATETDAQLFGRMAGSILYASPYLRADEALLSKNRQGQSGLWGYAISGDLPIVLLQITDMANIDLVRQLVQAHAYWRVKGMAVDLVIWNEDHSSYRQQLHDHIMGLLAGSAEAHVLDRPGGIFIRRGEQIAPEDRILMQAVARVIILDTNGKLVEQLTSRLPADLPLRPHPLKPVRRSSPEKPPVLPQRNLLFNNGFGGFASDAREYVITVGQEQRTPVPWSNILANPQFGTVISESGNVYTWCENAHEYRLTPWHNDPVCDSSGEAYYLRDEESGDFWSPAPLPSPGAASYVTRHGFGYSVFEHAGKGVFSELWIYVARDVPVKFVVLRIRNDSGRFRRLSATGYVEWVLGDLPEKTRMHVVTEIDPASGVLLARNPYNNEFSSRVAFFDVDDRTQSVTGDRTEFIGRNGRMRNPAGMIAQDLSGRVGAGLDPCGAIRVPFDLPEGATREVVFRLGAGLHREAALETVQRMRGLQVAHDELEKVRRYWDRTLGGVQVETPDPSVNVMVNGWLLYQVIACRLWGRSGYYQSGGAFGFRDQLQDVMALVHVEPALVREHLLRAAARQFIEGDVQHWWHPPVGRGIRSRCSDDYLWLPLVACHYVVATGDTGVLTETVSFLEGRPVALDEESYYDLPAHSAQVSSLYDHCVRAITHGLRFGEHGLPLMGTGDWNDGMNLVGFHGRGESIWLGFFLYDILIQFSDLAVGHGDAAFAERCKKEADKLGKNIEQHGWDGKWYLRAYFDDGSPLGSSSNTECRIDSIAQSWSVLSRGGSPQRQREAMQAVDEQLVRRDARLIQLLDPPFDHSDLDPGYIKGYVPGVRENGGQYTHAAIWATMAFAVLRDHKRAWELLSMINPVNHGRSLEAVSVYKTEPYVVSADVYAVLPHTGRGGWSWYTGSAGWLYRLMLETMLGLTREGAKLHFNPCLPQDWTSFTVKYRYGETVYPISVNQADIDPDEEVVIADGTEQRELTLSLVDDRAPHNVEVRVSRSRDSSHNNEPEP
ncbi:Cellobiose phosphorylase [Nitrosospira multiformis ATCC 25196]|uniref:Cellobiose phosphorylase n=1 Tax=Nitrosospira multiformis (strain ATCC 25196 / NCIMB 11849 / C 71) TaxID=323848 RepID=Q2Y9T5_NITMU|nr:glycosyltransferase 36 [Nitrosospira multiformis ATCC 25196]SEF88131.1 Cellobiose phosphorylase [Nitrosospira multiformis ATCC 25196]